MTHQKSEYICELLNIEYIDFSIPENFLKLMDLIFKLYKHFHLHIKYRINNFLEDTLSVLSEEIEERKIEQPLIIKEFVCMIRKENWSNNAG